MKRKIILLTLILSLIALPVFAGGTFTLQQVPYPVLVNGSQINSNLPILTYKTNGGDNTYVPLRAVLDLMEAKTTWDGKKVNVQVGADPAKVANSVVMVYVVKNGKRVSQGSGVLIDYDEILTVSHLADSGTGYEIIYNDGNKSTATLKDDAPEIDAAILEPTRKDVKPVKVGDSEESFNKLFVISSPKQKRNVILNGEYLRSSIINSINGFLTTAITETGSSGGGVFNINGELVGMVQSGDGYDSFAVPINKIRKKFAN